MATLVLQTAGAVVGGLFGGVGAIVGRAAGALAGYAIDQAVFGGGGSAETRMREGARLADLDVQASQEGAAVPRVYGKARLSGQVIWATRFEEVVSEEVQQSGGGGGGKGGGGGGGATATTIIRSYSYYANFAVALCEGPISRIGRVWADGKPIDLGDIVHRVHRGTEDQGPDSLIEAKQGSGRAPAYRGTAYVVFERLPLEAFGDRIPQLSFEVIRPVSGVERQVRAVALIPGASEFGYDPEPVHKVLGPGRRVALNRHVDNAASDWEASLDELEAVCPALERVSLVVTWFGDDLRAGECRLRPAVEEFAMATEPQQWFVAGLERTTAPLVSRYLDRAAFGGTPSDAAVIRAIRDLKARGLKVVFNPFVMMDIPAGNGLADPRGSAEQPAYPWRGDITASVAPGRPGSPDKTAAAAAELAAFVGTAARTDFGLAGDRVTYDGPGEWSFRRFILHYAHLCKAAGGVDAFLLCSELRGLTTLRAGTSDYPFVTALKALAGDVRDVLGGATLISYGADWSEYFGHQPADGSGDVHFHLDPLWADAEIDFVGIDNYMPLADWRDGAGHLDEAEWESPRDRAYLRANIAGGEGYHWYYATPEARAAQQRSPISDGQGKPWVFRPKDLVSWWSNPHHDRPGGVEAATPTAWQPRSKPIWFTEIGCPAIDKGANEPNAFPDVRTGAHLPHFSTGRRDDLMQRRFMEAVTGYWDPAVAGFSAAGNPVSPVYGGRMVDPAAIHWWAWDARPYPAFPYRSDIWSDGANWETGHWLNGRLGEPDAETLVAAILDDYGFEHRAIENLDGALDGYVIAGMGSARQALEPLAELLLFEAAESGSVIRFVARARRPSSEIAASLLVEEAERPLVAVRRAQETELPSEVSVAFSDALADYRATSVASRRLVTGSRRTSSFGSGAVLSHASALGLADARLQDMWAARETFSFALAPEALWLEPGDICDLALPSGTRTIFVSRIEDAGLRRIEGRSIEPDILHPVPAAARILPPEAAPSSGPPEVVLLDLPLLVGSDRPHAPRIAAYADPWPGGVAVSIGGGAQGFGLRQMLDRPARIGRLATPLAPGPIGRWDRANAFEMVLHGGDLAAEAPDAVLNGANAAAIGDPATGWEIIQFAGAELVGERRWRLSGLLRGQAGTGDVMAAGHPEGATLVMIDRATPPLAIGEAEAGLELTVRCGPAGAAYAPDLFVDTVVTPGRRGLQCLPPVHPSARREDGAIAVAWIRQTRIGGDPWEPAEVPLGEAEERYRLEILAAGVPVHAVETTEPRAVLADDLLADLFGAPPATLAVRISQLSPTEGPGLATEATLNV